MVTEGWGACAGSKALRAIWLALLTGLLADPVHSAPNPRVTKRVICGEFLRLGVDEPVEFPLTLMYELGVTNPVATSEMGLRNVRVCDAELVSDANGPAPDEVYLGPCGLDVVTGCADLGEIPVGGSETVECAVIVPSYDAWRSFASSDGVEDYCYHNGMVATGEPDVGDRTCGSIVLRRECESQVCIPPPCVCDVQVLKEACIFPPPPSGGEGCTPGFWKNHLGAWPAGIQPTDDFNTTFGVDAFDPALSLIEALNHGGGGIYALGRHATAALLNATSSLVNYGMTAAEVISAVQTAYTPGGDIEGTKNRLESFNEEGCPIGRGNVLNSWAVHRGKNPNTGVPPEPTECLPAIPCGTTAEVEFRYTVTNPTDCALRDITIVDDVFGDVPGGSIGVLNPGESLVFVLRTMLSEQMTNTVTVTAQVSGQTCDATSTVTVHDDCNGDGGGEGCTPGFWKNHLDWWPDAYQPDHDFDTVFGVNVFDPDLTLLDAARRGGGGVNALGRHAVAALLNAESEGVDYGMSTDAVIAAVQAALGPGGDVEGTKDHFERFNETGCPLGGPKSTAGRNPRAHGR